jgi:hypothetical protein
MRSVPDDPRAVGDPEPGPQAGAERDRDRDHDGVLENGGRRDHRVG